MRRAASLAVIAGWFMPGWIGVESAALLSLLAAFIIFVKDSIAHSASSSLWAATDCLEDQRRTLD